MTKDEIASLDDSGTLLSQFMINASFGEMWARHEGRLAHAQDDIGDYSNLSAIEALEWQARTVVEANVGIGNARFVDEQQGLWRYTWKGLFRSMASNFGAKHRREAISQKERIRIPRPGDSKYVEIPEFDVEIVESPDDENSATGP